MRGADPPPAKGRVPLEERSATGVVRSSLGGANSVAMGWGQRLVRPYFRQAKPRKRPMPQRAMATVGTTVHRLSWSDKHAGYRMKCSCGWVDSMLRMNEREAVNTGNAHVLAVRRAASGVPRWGARAGWIVLLIAAVVIGTVVVVSNLTSGGPYNDGYQWGEANTVGVISKTAPRCSQAEMTSSGP